MRRVLLSAAIIRGTFRRTSVGVKFLAGEKKSSLHAALRRVRRYTRGVAGQLRITGGQARGRPLPGSVGVGVRPTSSRVREALFSMVGQDLTGMRVLDAYGGSGVLALEAWSRGGDVVVFERSPRTVRAIELVVASFKASIVVRQGEVERANGSMEAFDLVMADPPYARDPLEVVGRLGGLVGHCLVLETSPGHALPDVIGGLHLDRHRTYGHCDLWLFHRKGDEG